MGTEVGLYEYGTMPVHLILPQMPARLMVDWMVHAEVVSGDPGLGRDLRRPFTY
jgi:hypothetical protein